MKTQFTVSALFVALCSGGTLANPVDGFYFDGPDCDNHGSLRAIEELGEGALFPQDELITSVWTQTDQTACPLTDDPGMINALVEITNLSGRRWDNLFYVADPETSFSSVDGLAESAAALGVRTEAFRIDALGGNRNLVFESMGADGVFDVGETWAFIIQDYSNAVGLPPSFGSLDFAGASFGEGLSTGSIVQFVVPTPGSLALLGLGGLAAAKRRR